MKKNIYYTLGALLLVAPVSVFAALDGVKGLLVGFRGLLNILIPIVFGLGLLFFFWGSAQFILNAADSKTRDDAKQRMLWGVIALFVMVSIYGILNWISGLTGISIGGTINSPGGAPCGYIDASQCN